VVLGGAGFVGSHLVDRLLAERFEVVAVDDFVTGRRDNLAPHPKLRLVEHDICKPIPVVGPLEVIFNLASPASPVDYERLPLVTTYARVHGTTVQLARIFNTYGPRMRKDDGRVVPAFVSAAIEGRDFEVFGDGRQTRSFCYVDDLVSGLLALWKKGDGMPVNL